MSKSGGNIFQLSEALDRYGREAVLDYLISGHYRQPLAFDAEQLRQASMRVKRLRNFFREHPRPPEIVDDLQEEPFVTARRVGFRDALAEDFNTPRAMAEVFDLLAEANRRELGSAPAALAEMLELLGLGSLTKADGTADPEAEELLRQRQAARAARDFERADQIRADLDQLGWEVRDSASGARLVRKG